MNQFKVRLALIALVLVVLGSFAETAFAETQRYTVAPGDTLVSIAVKFNVSATALLHANQIRNPNRIIIGQELTIPAPPNDTLDKRAEPDMARRHHLYRDWRRLVVLGRGARPGNPQDRRMGDARSHAYRVATGGYDDGRPAAKAWPWPHLPLGSRLAVRGRRL